MGRIRPHLAAAGVASFAINVLYLASPLYMLQIYDRVLSSGSMTTLAFVTAILLVATAALAALDAMRSRMLVLAGEELDDAVARRLLSGMLLLDPVEARERAGTIREFDALRSFFSGSGVQVLFDAPWSPFFILVCALLHPWLGALALFGCLALLAVAWLQERGSRAAAAGAHESAVRAYADAESALGGAEALRALGMRGRIVERWLDNRIELVSAAADEGRRSAGISGFAKFLRLALQSGGLGVGAFLVIRGEMTAGAIIAGSILIGRALSPLDQVFGAWRSGGAAHGAYKRVKEVLQAENRAGSVELLAAPSGRLTVRDLVANPPGLDVAILKRISFDLEAGQCLGVVGQSGSGKSTLARILAGAWSARSGVVRLDGVDIAQLHDEGRGRHVGYLPQDAVLFPGSVADNISRFDRYCPDPDMDIIQSKLVRAAKEVAAHELIMDLPQGYETPVGPGGVTLSGGQRQRIALARAFYDDPSLLVLDEPNTHLDAHGERALMDAIAAAKRRGCSIVVAAHRALILSQADTLLLLRDGSVVDVGRREDVIRRLDEPPHLAAVSGARP